MKTIYADYFTNKKVKVTFFLSILVFFIHISTLANYNLSNDFSGKVLQTIHKLIWILSQVAVPMFFIISGIMFYRNYSIEKTLEKYKSRFFSLVIPYWFWNTICMIFDIICSYTPISNYFIGREKFQITFINIIWGIFFHKCTPFWFIFNLIIFIFLCPLIYFLIKNKIVGVLIIISFIILNMFNIGLPKSIFFRSDPLIYYLIGSFIGKHYFSCFYNKSNKSISIISLIIGVVCYFILFINYYNIINLSFLLPIIFIIFSLSIWFSFDLLKNNKHYAYEKESFLIYALHINTSAIFTKLVYIILPKTILCAAINFILTIIVTIILICTFGIIIEKYLPKFKKIIAGR